MRIASAVVDRRRDGWRSTYQVAGHSAGGLERFFEAPPQDVLGECRATLSALVELYRSHRFDLLGSGWVEVRHGLRAAGVEGHRYPPGVELLAGDVDAVESLVNESNRRESRRVRSLVGSNYEPIDWHVDFKSGFRWDGSTWYRDIRYGNDLGADVKVPWELGRCQHLPQMALRACLARAEDDSALVDQLASEYRNQVLDFVAANPPRYGVQWVTAMDVAIRIANWLLAYDLFRSIGHGFDDAFNDVFARSVGEHGSHIVGNLEWSRELRGNHYLSDVVGLLFVAAFLPPSTTVDGWLLFASRELIHETRAQFHSDGGGFEGSTCYHRLSAEMVTYGLALLLALPDARVTMLFDPAGDILRGARGFPGEQVAPLEPQPHAGSRRTPVPVELLERIGRARSFTADITKPTGDVPQLGDNDSGRFFRLAPVITVISQREAVRRYANLDGVIEPNDDAYLDENHLDHRHLIDAIDGLLGRPPDRSDEPLRVDGTMIRGLGGPDPAWALLDTSRADRVKVGNDHALREFDDRLDALPASRRIEMHINLGHRPDDPQRRAFPIFGAYLLRTPRVYLMIRCGPRGQNGFAGHDHNDQLAVELNVDGEDWIRDPGTYLYTPIPEVRNRYRSVRAHFAPQLAGPEPASLDEGPFILGPGSEASCVYWGDAGFAGLSQSADGRISLLRLQFDGSALSLVHAVEGGELLPVAGDRADWRSHLSKVPYSPGYGIVEQTA